MDRKTIEEKDKNLLKEVRRIVRTNQGKKKTAKPFWRFPIFWMAVFFFVIIGIGLTAFRQKPTIIASKNETSTSEVRVKKAPLSTADVLAKQSDAAAAELPTQSNEKPGKKANTAAQIRTAQPTGKTESYNIRIIKIVTCTGIHEKQYVLEKSTFSLKEKSKPTVWMSVRSDTQPFTITHAYFLNDHPYCEVPLEIRYPRMRTWSSVTLHDEKQLGHWRLEVLTDDGNRLTQIEFTVVP